MNSLRTLVEKIGCALESEQGLNKNLLQSGEGNLEGAEVIFDKDIPAYGISKKSGQIHYFGHTPFEAERKDMPRRRITAFKNPDLIFLLVTGDWFSVQTQADLFTLKDYQEQHQGFLKYISRHGFVNENEQIVSIFQELIDKECEIYEEIISKYNSQRT